jgi:hypothetical protein
MSSPSSRCSRHHRRSKTRRSTASRGSSRASPGSSSRHSSRHSTASPGSSTPSWGSSSRSSPCWWWKRRRPQPARRAGRRGRGRTWSAWEPPSVSVKERVYAASAVRRLRLLQPASQHSHTQRRTWRSGEAATGRGSGDSGSAGAGTAARRTGRLAGAVRSSRRRPASARTAACAA